MASFRENIFNNNNFQSIRTRCDNKLDSPGHEKPQLSETSGFRFLVPKNYNSLPWGITIRGGNFSPGWDSFWWEGSKFIHVPQLSAKTIASGGYFFFFLMPDIDNIHYILIPSKKEAVCEIASYKKKIKWAAKALKKIDIECRLKKKKV